jgi:hypothetical protein
VPPAAEPGNTNFVARPVVVAFVSAGRCGTDWVAEGLRTLHRDIDVEHEPIGPLYKPRLYFRRYAEPDAILEVPEVAAHLRRIEAARRPYVETGWPLFPALPLLAERLPDRLRVVHLTRHPVPSALAHLAQKCYAGSPSNDAYTRLATLGPEDPNVFQPYYASSWDRLTPYEKVLFWWTEIHLFALELPGRVDGIPLLRICAEDILSARRPALQRLLEFIGLPWREDWLAPATRLVDRWHHPADERVDPLEVHRHPTTVDVAQQLGYQLTGLNAGVLEARYRGQSDTGLDPIGRLA